jgi:4-hydroxyphenylacetate 3-monooxygenase
MSGSEHLKSLDDGRNVYLYGERVKDVTRHSAFRNSARSVAQLYDKLRDPAEQDSLTTIDRFGIRTHRFSYRAIRRRN